MERDKKILKEWIFALTSLALLIGNFLRRLVEDFRVDSSWFVEDRIMRSLDYARDAGGGLGSEGG
jgi:hypothetical protein